MTDEKDELEPEQCESCNMPLDSFGACDNPVCDAYAYDEEGDALVEDVDDEISDDDVDWDEDDEESVT